MSKLPLTLKWFSGYFAGASLVFLWEKPLSNGDLICGVIYLVIALVLHTIAENKYKKMTSFIPEDVKVYKRDGFGE